MCTFTDGLEIAVLKQIASDNRLDPVTVHIGDQGAVFYSQEGQLRCICQKGSHYWNEVFAGLAAARVIERAKVAR